MQQQRSSAPCLAALLVFAACLWAPPLARASERTEQVVRKDRHYNHVNVLDVDSYAAFKATHMTGDCTNRNILLGVYSPECRRDVETVAFRGAQRHSGNVLQVISVPLRDFPMALTDGACSELLMYRFNSTIAEPHYRTTDFDHTHVNNWVAESLRTEFRVRNKFDYPVTFYWHDESQKGRKQKLLAPGQSTTITSFLGHVFSAHRDSGLSKGEDDGVSGEMVDFMVVDGSEYEFSPSNRLETCEIVPGSSNSRFVDADQISCDDMHMRFVEFSHNVWYEKRLGLNYVQPALVESVTDAGFENRRLPEATFAWLRDWFEEKQRTESIVEGPVGPCMNQHVSESIMTHLTPEKKDQLSDELHPILEEWYGGRLELTSIYGVRRYTNGSVLRMHVDTVNTHVVSAIINVGQGVDKDWPLIILDHEDNEHTVIMQPGDMLLYESAKLLHGRPEPFQGSHYDNIFIHYKPRDGSWNYDWM